MMRAPLDQFAERLIRNGEIGEFLKGLIEKTSHEFVKNIVDKVVRETNPNPPRGDSRPEYMRHY
jgi:hypothetical protein